MNNKTTYKNVFGKVFLLSVALLYSVHLMSCKCPSVTPISKELATRYDIIFFGKVDSISSCATSGISKAYFTVEELYKGRTTQQVHVQFDCLSSCMMSFSKNDEWIIYATYQRFDVIAVELCSHTRKQFPAAAQDFYLAAAGRTFDQEKEFLKTELGTQSFVKTETWNTEQQELKPHNDQPSSSSKIYLLLVSFGVMILIYIITRKKKKEND